MTQLDEHKRKVAEAALEELPAEGIIGLGTGSTARFFIEALAARIRAGAKYQAVATSEASRAQAEALGIPLLDDDGPWEIEVTVDGADEVDGEMNLIKGGGAAHTREKIVNGASRKNVIVVDESKLSARIGEKWPVPIEVLPFAHKTTQANLARYGTPTLRMHGDVPLRTDSGNFIYDLAAGPIHEPSVLEMDLRALPGVVETGLFVDRADIILVAGLHGVRRISEAGSSQAK